VTPAERNLDVLPRWARERIERLEAEVTNLKALRSAGPDDTNTFVDHMADRTEGPQVQYQPLRRDAVVTFWTGPGYPQAEQGRLTAVLGEDRRGHYLEVASTGMAAALSVEPWTTNVVRIREVSLR
jgi:hypothetical protein